MQHRSSNIIQGHGRGSSIMCTPPFPATYSSLFSFLSPMTLSINLQLFSLKPLDIWKLLTFIVSSIYFQYNDVVYRLLDYLRDLAFQTCWPSSTWITHSTQHLPTQASSPGMLMTSLWYSPGTRPLTYTRPSITLTNIKLKIEHPDKSGILSLLYFQFRITEECSIFTDLYSKLLAENFTSTINQPYPPGPKPHMQERETALINNKYREVTNKDINIKQFLSRDITLNCYPPSLAKHLKKIRVK